MEPVSAQVRIGVAWCLLHGTPLDPSVWDEVAAQLPRNDSVIQPAVTVTTTRDAPVPELAQRLLVHLDPENPPHLVGHSFGGQVALEMALLAPERVRSLTLICSRDTPYPAFGTTASALLEGKPIDVDAALHRWFLPEELSTESGVVQYARRCLTDADRLVWAASLNAIARFDRSDRTPALKVPLTLVAAEFDQVSTVAAMQEFASRVPGSRFTVLHGAGHMSPFLRPAELAALISRSAASS